jgi:hypothetical protein
MKAANVLALRTFKEWAGLRPERPGEEEKGTSDESRHRNGTGQDASIWRL